MIVLCVTAMLVCASAAPIEDKHFAVGFEESLYPELGEYFEGDMVLTEEQRMAISQAMDEASPSRNGLRDGTKRWPNNTLVYEIKEDDFDEDELQKIKEAIDDIASKSCIKFRPKSGDEHAVVIQGTGNGCYSSVGQVTVDDDGSSLPNQTLNLQTPNCVTHGTIVHEMLHALGFYHMQSTYDRDDFVKIEWQNIKSGTEHNFAKYNNDTVTDFGVEYDYGSVMHYPEYAFSKNGNKTIIPLKEGVTIGQRKGMSERDVLKLNKMYCDESAVPDEQN